MLFSQRKGLEPIKNIIQADSMDQDLRIGLWNQLQFFYWSEVRGVWLHEHSNRSHFILCERLWVDFFKKPLDELEKYFPNIFGHIKSYYFGCNWNEVYDFIEFVTNNYPVPDVNVLFEKACNKVLEKELSGYRFVNSQITEITSKEEVSEIEEALNIPDKFKGTRAHLKSALKNLSDRKSPDYRNSIKESISAVESTINSLIGKKLSLKAGLEKIEKERDKSLHPALKEAFIKLYGYTSDADGIRHALVDEPNLNFNDAKFMLVSCSAFVNYLISKFHTE